MPVDSPEPIRFRKASSSTPEMLALCFFSGLPMNASLSRKFKLGSGRGSSLCGGVVACIFVAGGVDTDAGVWGWDVLDVSVLPKAPESGSAECCRFSYRMQSASQPTDDGTFPLCGLFFL